MTHGSLFSGIGGFDLAAEWAGFENIFQVELDTYCQKVLQKNFPNVKKYWNIKTFDANEYKGKIDIISGGFPCQPFSGANSNRKGIEDDRYLWPEMFRIICEVEPGYVLAENVYGILNQGGGLVFEQVLSDLESKGYEVQPVIIPACSKNAIHKRDRVWFIAHSTEFRRRGRNNKRHSEIQERSLCQSIENNGNRVRSQIKRCDRCGISVTNPNASGCEKCGREWFTPIQFTQDYTTAPEPGIRGMANGLSNRLDRISGCGNAIVPQIALEIYKTFNEIEKIIF